MTITIRRLLAGFASVALLAGGWYFLAPPQLAGSTSYVEIYGTSMQPRFHAGDLVVVRAASSYRVGEVVAYRNQALGGNVVLHRIIGSHDGRYTFKGDNNDFVDSYRPAQSELVGALRLHVPAVGHYLVWLRGARLLLVAALASLVILLVALRPGMRRIRRGSLPVPARGSLGGARATAAVLVLGFVGLAALAYARPTSAPALRQGLYAQTGRFSYEASAPQGKPVYGATTVTTGQPLFLRLVRDASFRFAYRFDSAAVHAVAGRIGLDAKVSATNGWHRTLHVAGFRPFSGDRAEIAGDLDLRSLTRLVERVDALGSVAGGTYTLTLLPRVELRGRVAGNPVEQTFAPRLDFLLDPNQLQLQPGGADGPSAASGLTKTSEGSGAVTAPSTISLLKLRLPVELARRIGVVGGSAALLLLLGSLLLARWGRPEDEHAGAVRRYGDLIVPAAALPPSWSRDGVRTSSLDDLARVAEQTGRMIVHVEAAGSHVYCVDDGGVLYTYGDDGRPDGQTTEVPLRVAGGRVA